MSLHRLRLDLDDPRIAGATSQRDAPDAWLRRDKPHIRNRMIAIRRHGVPGRPLHVIDHGAAAHWLSWTAPAG